VLLLAAIAAIRFDMLKIQQNALVALQRYLHNHVAATAGRFDTLKIQQNALVALQRYLHNNNGNKSTKASVNQEEREHEINTMFRLSKLPSCLWIVSYCHG
jgi:hypothetical protein